MFCRQTCEQEEEKANLVKRRKVKKMEPGYKDVRNRR